MVRPTLTSTSTLPFHSRRRIPPTDWHPRSIQAGERLAERMRRIPKEIGIAVEQDVQMDPLGDVDLKHPHHQDRDTPHGADSEYADGASQTRDRDRDRKVHVDDLEFQAV